jgi:chromosome segregation protein
MDFINPEPPLASMTPIRQSPAMNQTELPAFDHGAKWLCADFHLHTLKESGASRKEYRAEFRDREQEFPADFIHQLKTAGIKIAAITNHNSFNFHEFKTLNKLAKKEGILLLPGVEIGVKEGRGGIHTLVIFDPEKWLSNDQSPDQINRFISAQFPSSPDEGTRSKDDLCGVLNCLEGFGHDYFMIFAHAQSGNGFFNELEGGAIQELVEQCGKLWKQRVLGFQKIKNLENILKIWPKRFSFPAQVEGSDPKTFDEVGKSDRPCYLKLGEPSYSSVEFALRDHQQRVSLEPPDAPPLPRLQKVHFEGGLLDGRAFHLNHQLNCLIGSRGSGKSSFIECLRYGLALDAEEDAPYKNKLVAAMMGNGGKITIEGRNPHDQAFRITRIFGNNPIVFLEGGETKLRPKDVLPHILYFGQKDLGVRDENFEADFFTKLLPEISLEDRDKEERLLAELNRAVDEWRSVKTAEDKEKIYAQEFEQLKHQLELFKKMGVEKRLERLTQFDADKRRLAEFVDDLDAFRKELDLENFGWKDFSDEWITLKSPELEELAEQLDEARKVFTSLATDHADLLVRFDSLVVTLKAHRILLQEKEKDLQEDFAKIQREIDQPGLDIKEFRSLKQKHEQLGKLLIAAKDRGGATKAAQDKILSTARALQEHRRIVFNQRLDALTRKQEQLPESIKLELTYEGQKQSFVDFLKSKLAGKGFRNTSYDLISAQFKNGFQLYEQMDKIDETLNGTADVDKLKTAINEQLADFLAHRVDDKKVIRFHGTSVRELSLGQRATALLQLLMSLDEQNILILDQPEDDLDNETVFQQVVRPLLEKKRRTQFIIATHNPNIPVLGDAELVHACHEKEKGVYSHDSGSLDSRITRTSIVNIMEGGKAAFEQRKKVYQQWTNSN